MRNKPRIRFKGFTEDWEQRKLGDFYTFKNGLNKEKVYFGYGDSIVNFTDVFHNRQIYSSTLKGKVFVNKKELENFRVKEGDLFFTRTSETIDEIGFPAVVMEPMERVVFSGFVLRGRAEKNDPLVNIFKSYIFFTDNFRSEMKKKSSMTTRALTSGTALKEMYFSYPKDLEEQTKIGEILLRLDNIITLHQRKLEKLKLAKKALLQKLFPKNGSQFPEIRFKGFTDAWEQRKLGEVVKSYSGGTPTASNKEYYGGDIPFIRSAEINSDTTELYITQKGLDNSSAKTVEKGTILYAMYGATSGEVGISKINGAINQAILAMIPLDYDGKIIAQYLRKNKESIIGKYLQGGQGNLSANIILELPIQLPGLEESNQIAYFLESVDTVITLHQCKLDKLQDVKKGLLQKMFV